ncbi:hypothetical protein [Priestia megaterium]|uniref:hypothetical protein n=1 Tax=Priestia megaterium TaxID=1404 RepID=UPI0032426AF5
MKMNQSYFDSYCTPEEIARLTKKEREGLALSRKGYAGHLVDKRRNFYFDRTGIPWTCDAVNANTNPNK